MEWNWRDAFRKMSPVLVWLISPRSQTSRKPSSDTDPKTYLRELDSKITTILKSLQPKEMIMGSRKFQFKDFPIIGGRIEHAKCGCVVDVYDLDEAITFYLEHECPKAEEAYGKLDSA